MLALRHELLQDVAAHARAVAVTHGISDDVAEQIGNAVADRLVNNWGGQVISFPKDQAYKLATRDLAIFDDWAYRSMRPNQLAQKYDLTIQAIYEILRRARKLALDEKQKKLDL